MKRLHVALLFAVTGGVFSACKAQKSPDAQLSEVVSVEANAPQGEPSPLEIYLDKVVWHKASGDVALSDEQSTSYFHEDLQFDADADQEIKLSYAINLRNVDSEKPLDVDLVSRYEFKTVLYQQRFKGEKNMLPPIPPYSLNSIADVVNPAIFRKSVKLAPGANTSETVSVRLTKDQLRQYCDSQIQKTNSKVDKQLLDSSRLDFEITTGFLNPGQDDGATFAINAETLPIRIPLRNFYKQEKDGIYADNR